MAEGEQRRLAAILAADVVGYSRLVGNGEAGMRPRLHALRQDVIDPDDPPVLAILGAARVMPERAIAIDPNAAWALGRLRVPEP